MFNMNKRKTRYRLSYSNNYFKKLLKCGLEIKQSRENQFFEWFNTKKNSRTICLFVELMKRVEDHY